MSTMIRGYGLPSEGASSYNGYGRYGHGGNCCVAERPRYARMAGYTTLPDPELGGYGAAAPATEPARSTGVLERQLPTAPVSPGASGGLLMLGAAAALFFFLKR